MRIGDPRQEQAGNAEPAAHGAQVIALYRRQDLPPFIGPPVNQHYETFATKKLTNYLTERRKRYG